MGFSFHDQNSMAEASAGSLRFAPPSGHNRSLESETGSIVIVYQEVGDDDLRLAGTQLTSRDNWDIEMVDRGCRSNMQRQPHPVTDSVLCTV